MASRASSRLGTVWNLGLSAYWFATSFKWFLLLFGGLLSSRVNQVVPGGEQNASWGLVVMLGSLEALIGPILVGYWSDRVGKRLPFLGVGAVMTALAVLLAANAASLEGMIVAYLLIQIADDVATAPYAALIPDLVPEDHRGRSSGIMAALQQSAQIIAAITGLALGASPLTIFLVIAALNLLGAGITIWTARGHTAIEPRPVAGLSADTWLAPWRLPDFRWVWFTRFLNSVGFYCVILYALNYLTDVVKVYKLGPVDLGNPKTAFQMLGLLIPLVATFSALRSGKLSDTIGRKLTIRRAGILMFVTLVPFALIPNYTAIFALATLFAVGYGAYQSADWALVSDILPNPEDHARDMGMWSMSVPLGQTVAGMGGFAIDAINRSAFGWGYSAIYLVAAVCFLLSTELVMKIKGSS